MSNKEQRKAPVLRFKGFTDDWEQRKLKDTANFAKGIGYSKKDLKSSGIPIILYGRLYTKYETVINEIDTFTQPKKDTFLSKGGEIIVPASGETAEDISVASVVKNKGIILGGDLNIVYPNSSLNSVFLALNITYGRAHDEMRRRAQGKTIVHLHNSDLANIKLKIPTISEQKKIVYLLEKINKLIALQQRKLDQFKQLKTMCLANMFFNSANHVTKLRFVGFTDNVEKQSFGNTISHKSGTSIEKYFSPKGQYKVISIGSYGLDGEYIDQGIRAVSNEKTNSHLIRKGELSMVLNDKTDGKILGRTLLINKDNEYVVNQRSEIIKPNPALWDTQFAFTYLNGPFRKKVIRIMQGGTQKYINFSSVEKLNVFLPEVQEQQKIGFLFKKIDAIICHHQQKILSLKQTRKFLLQNLFI